MRRAWAVIFTGIAVGALALAWVVRSAPAPHKTEAPAPVKKAEATPQAAAGAPAGMKIPPPLPSCTEFKTLTPEEVFNAGEKYENACVRWTLPLRGLRPAGQVAMLFFAPVDGDVRTIETVAPVGDYPQLKQVKVKDPIEVRGRVTWVQGARMALHDVKLAFPDAR